MPAETIVFIVAVIFVFGTFGAVLAWVDQYSKGATK